MQEEKETVKWLHFKERNEFQGLFRYNYHRNVESDVFINVITDIINHNTGVLTVRPSTTYRWDHLDENNTVSVKGSV